MLGQSRREYLKCLVTKNCLKHILCPFSFTSETPLNDDHKLLGRLEKTRLVPCSSLGGFEKRVPVHGKGSLTYTSPSSVSAFLGTSLSLLGSVSPRLNHFVCNLIRDNPICQCWYLSFQQRLGFLAFALETQSS